MAIELAVPPPYVCGKCRMSFVIAAAPMADTERLRCPECYKPFWSSMLDQGRLKRRQGLKPRLVCGMEKRP